MVPLWAGPVELSRKLIIIWLHKLDHQNLINIKRTCKEKSDSFHRTVFIFFQPQNNYFWRIICLSSISSSREQSSTQCNMKKLFFSPFWETAVWFQENRCFLRGFFSMTPPQKFGKAAAAAVGSGPSPGSGSLGAFSEWTGCAPTSWDLPDTTRKLVTS